MAIFGVTFKEDCPDIRNTRVVDIYQELMNFGVQVYVHDPLASPSETRESHDIDLVDLENLPAVDALILAVAHGYYKDLSAERYKKLLKSNAVIVDIKGILDGDYYRHNGYSLCGL